MNCSESAPSTVILLDDHALVLEGLKKLLEQMPEISGIDTAGTTCELLSRLKYKKYDFCFLDIELYGENGLDVVNDIRRLAPGIAIVVCTMHEEIWTAQALLRLRPEGIILKLSGADSVKSAVRAIRRGETYRCPRFEQLAHKLSGMNSAAVRKNVPTPRELDVLKAIARGFSSAEIARQLCLTENTVESYRKNLLLKLEARNVADLVMKGVERGYLGGE